MLSHVFIFQNYIRNTMASGSDKLMKPIFDIFDRILAHINGYSGGFLQDSDIQLLQGVRPVFKTILSFRWPHRKKS